MANTKISALTSATTPLAGTEVLPIVQSSATVKVAVSDLTAGRAVSASSMTLSTALAATSGGTGSTSAFVANAIPYASSTTVLTTGSALTFNGTNLGVGVAAPVSIVEASSTTPVITASQSSTSVSINTLIGAFNAYSYDATVNSKGGVGGVRVYSEATWNTGGTASYLSFYTHPSSANNNTLLGGAVEAGRFLANGNFIVGDTTADSRVRILGANSSDLLFRAVVFAGTSAVYTCASNASISTGESGAASVWYIRKDAATSRSINAAGTINASGADYAEYMTKAGDFNVAKGDVVGIDAQGKLTNVFADAVSFVVKSTDPSYVGGDVWGSEESLGLTQPKKPTRISDEEELRLVSEATETEEAVHETIVTKAGDSDQEWAAKEAAYLAEKSAFDAALETARQKVDRIAFAGQVPVNVLGATAGQYIVPVNDNGTIKGSAVSNPTFEQYQAAVGKVIAIEADGRARIIVKVV